MKIDLHVHTCCSIDSLSNLKSIIKKTSKLGIIPAITDHNNIDAHEHLKKMNFEFIPGEEIDTIEGHLIGLYLTEKIEKNFSFLETLDKIKEMGGLSYLPHMYDSTRRGVCLPELAKKVDIVEVYNPRITNEEYNKKALDYAQKNKKYLGVGSDAHFAFEIGSAYIESADRDIHNPKELIKVLKNGKIFTHRTGIPTMGTAALIRCVKKIFRL